MFFIRSQAVFNKPAGQARRRGKGDHANEHWGVEYVFVTNRERPRWKNGAAEFVISSANGFGEPRDYQAVLVWDPGENRDEYLIPVVFQGGEFRALGPYNAPPNGWAVQMYTFGSQDQSSNGSDNRVRPPMYLIRVRKNGRARIDRYILEPVASSGSSHIVKVASEEVYGTKRLLTDERLLANDMGPVIGAMAKFLLIARGALAEPVNV